MAKISERTVEEIRQIGIESIVEPYVDFVRKGRDLWACCPFHTEDTPSFKIDTERNFYKCFGCDAKGDSISFIKSKLGFSYVDAIVYLAEKYGINVEYVGEDNVYRKDILALHEDLQKIMRSEFYSNNGKVAYDYIVGRGFTDDDLNTFGIGYIPPRYNYNNIFKQYSKEVLLNSGYFKDGQYGTNARFFDRLMLPIMNVTGSIAAFAGRSLDGSEPKYLNSAESDLFHKRYTLFNIDKAKDAMKKSNSCIVVEGYFDVMRLYQAGYKNAVAPMGTALTVEQIGLIKRYASEVVLLFDGDKAGEKAAYRSLASFVQSGVFPKVVFLKEGDDPDSYILNNGAARFDKLLSSKEDLFINIAKKLVRSAKDDFNLKLDKYQTIKRMLQTVNDVHLRSHYSGIIADLFGLDKNDIDIELNKLRNKNSYSNPNKKQAVSANYKCELDFIACLAQLSVDVVDSLLCDMTENMFKSNEIKQIFKKILDISTNATYIDNFTYELGDEYVEIALRDVPEDNIYEFALENKKRIVTNYLDKRHEEIVEKQKLATSIEDKINYIKELDELTKQRVAFNT